MHTIREVEAVTAYLPSTPILLRLTNCIPSTQIVAPTAMRTNASTDFLSPVSGQSRRSVTATVTATESPDRLQASRCAPERGPGPFHRFPGPGPAVRRFGPLLFRTDEGEDDRDDCPQPDTD